MPVKKRSASGVGAKKANSVPIVIDLLDDDDTPFVAAVESYNGLHPMEAADSDEIEQKVVPVARVAKRTAKKSGRPKKTSSNTDSGASSLPVGSESALEFGETMSMRRAATIPIAQISSRTSTALSDSKDDLTPSATPEEPKYGFKTGMKRSSTAVASLESHKIATEPENQPKVEFERQATVLLPKVDEPHAKRMPSSATSSLPSKLPSSLSQSSQTTSNLPKNPSSSNMFRFSGSLDVHLVKNADIELLSELDHSTSGLKRSHLLMSSGDERFEEDEEEANLLLSGASQKKHCGPGRSSTSKIHSPPKTTTNILSKSGSLSPSAAPTATPPLTSEETDTGYKRTKTRTTPPAPKRVPSNPDDLLDEILGSSSSYSSASTSHRSYNPYARHDIAATRMALQQAHKSATSAPTTSATTYPTSSRYEPRTSNAAPTGLGQHSSTPGQLNLKLAIGKHFINFAILAKTTCEVLLQKLGQSGKLPSLLLNEKFIVKFDNYALEPTSTLADSLVGNGDTLVLSVLRDGKEVLDPFAELNQTDDAAEEEPVNDNKITIKAVYPNNEKVTYRISKDEPLTKLAEAAAKRLGVSVTSVRLEFDGFFLKHKQSIEELDDPLEDGDMINISVSK